MESWGVKVLPGKPLKVIMPRANYLIRIFLIKMNAEHFTSDDEIVTVYFETEISDDDEIQRFRLARLTREGYSTNCDLLFSKNFTLWHTGKGVVDVKGYSALQPTIDSILQPTIDPIQGEGRSSSSRSEASGSSRSRSKEKGEGKHKSRYAKPPKGKFNEGKKRRKKAENH